MKMSVSDEWNDMYLAHAYPFLYARKLRYAFANHLWERFLIFYGMWGMHLLVLIIITIAIVGGYRTTAQCNRFAPDGYKWLGVFAKQVDVVKSGREQLLVHPPLIHTLSPLYLRLSGYCLHEVLTLAPKNLKPCHLTVPFSHHSQLESDRLAFLVSPGMAKHLFAQRGPAPVRKFRGPREHHRQ